MECPTVSMVLLALLAGGCGSGTNSNVGPRGLGTLSIPLVASDGAGSTFGLRDATFAVDGVDVFDTEPFDPGRIEFLADLPSGRYLVLLRDGWQLVESVGGASFADVPAQLVSDNPTPVTIVAGQVVAAALRFRVNGQDIVLGKSRGPLAD